MNAKFRPLTVNKKYKVVDVIEKHKASPEAVEKMRALVAKMKFVSATF